MTAVAQPSGTVTLVFTDIEGSTRLLEELGTEAYREALAEHRRVVREAFARYAGYEVDYEGDAFFYAFASAAQARSPAVCRGDGRPRAGPDPRSASASTPASPRSTRPSTWAWTCTRRRGS